MRRFALIFLIPITLMLLIFYDLINSIFDRFCPESVAAKSGLNFERAVTPKCNCYPYTLFSCLIYISFKIIYPSLFKCSIYFLFLSDEFLWSNLSKQKSGYLLSIVFLNILISLSFIGLKCF